MSTIPSVFEPINLSAYADPLLDELVSGEPKIDDTIFLTLSAKLKVPSWNWVVALDA